MVSITQSNKKIIYIVSLVLIKYLYIGLIVLSLSNVWYPGIGSYGIDFIIQKEALATIIFILVSIVYLKLIPKNSFKRDLLSLLFLIYYIPLNSSFSLSNLSIEYFILTNLYFILIIIMFRLINVKSKSALSMDNNSVYWACVIICFFYILFKLGYNGFKFDFSFATDTIYSIRTDYNEFFLDKSGSFIGYFLTIIRHLSSTALPVLLYLSLRKKKIISVLFSFFVLLCMFSVNSSKSSIFFCGIVIFIVFIENKSNRKIVDIFLMLLLCTLIIAILSVAITGKSLIAIYLIRREMYVPSWIGSLYYDFFSSNSKLLWSDSALLLQRIIPDVYEQGVLSIINDRYFLGTMPSPNSGLFAEAYMQAGAIGVFIYPIITTLITNFIAKYLDGFSKGFIFLFAARIAITLTNVPLLRTDFIISSVIFVLALVVFSKVGKNIRKV